MEILLEQFSSKEIKIQLEYLKRIIDLRLSKIIDFFSVLFIKNITTISTN